MPARLPALLLASGCVTERTLFDEILPADTVTDLFCDIERGDFVYSGSAPDGFHVGVASWATGLSRGRAGARGETNRWGVTVADGRLDLWGRSPAARAGVDLVVEGPPAENVEVVLLDGVAQLFDATGTHTVTANEILGRGLSGDLDLYATSGGIDLDARPEPGQTLTLEAFGPVTLALPWGGDYDLEVFADPDWGAEVSDLGFDTLSVAPDYVSARTGSGAVRIAVVVRGGAFTLWNADL